MTRPLMLLLILGLAASNFGEAAELKAHGNPIRRVVTMLQEMQKTVEKEGETEKELYDKYMCYCDKTGAELTSSIDGGDGKISELTSQLEEDTAAKSQLDQDVGQHKTDRTDAEKSVSEATAMRGKEAAEFAHETGEMKSNIASVDGALGALRKGLGAAMLQTGVADFLRTVVRQSPLLGDAQREVLGSFLQGGSQEGSGGSDQILGILETMLENMQEDLKETNAAEASAKASYADLMKAKNAEVGAATKAIESKMGRSGELAVAIATGQEDLEDTKIALDEDTKMKANLLKSCAEKTKEYDERRGVRGEEVVAISETIKILNDDDSLDTFKKTMPSPAADAASFLQISSRKSVGRQVERARRVVRRLAELPHEQRTPQVSLLLLQLRSSTHTSAQGQFDKLLEMIERMIALLGKEQGDDDKQKEWCNGELDKAASDKAQTEEELKALDTGVERSGFLIENVETEIASLKAGITDLDTSVGQATEMRKKEHEEFTSTSAANQAALDLLDMAKNRLNKFYNPTMYNPQNTPPPGPYGFAQVSLVQVRAHAQRAGGVLQMLAQMMGDVEQDMAVGKRDELAAQKEYEEVMADAQAKRATDSKLIVTKETLKADLVSKLDDAKGDRTAADTLLKGLLVKIGDLHASCDFLLENYDARKEARTAEIEGLHQGKAVLSSAGGDDEAAAAAGFLQRS